MLGHVAHLAMYWHGNLRPNPAVHLSQFVARRVTGDMHEVILHREHLHAQRRELVVQRMDTDLVSRNNARGEDHRIARSETDSRVIPRRDARQCSARLALASGTEIE